MERRMAELLVRDHVPFAAIKQIGVRTAATEGVVRRMVDTMRIPPSVTVIPDWYY